MNERSSLHSQLNDLRRGALTDLLRRRGATHWLRLASTRIIEESIDQILPGASAQGGARFDPSQVAALPKRLLLARNAKLLQALYPPLARVRHARALVQ